jgi:hypothetical protein
MGHEVIGSMETLAALSVELHGVLPRLDDAEAVHALQAKNRILRMAAIVALGPGSRQ